MQEIKKQVELILKSYTGMKQELKVLAYEMEGLQRTLDPRVIEDQVLSHPGVDWVSGSQPSDKTADIVIDHVDSQRNAKYHALKSLIHNISSEVNRLDYYLTLLPEEEAAVIRLFYFEAMSVGEVARAVFAPERTVQRRKNRGIEKLVSFYNLLDTLGDGKANMRNMPRFISHIHEERFADCLERAKDSGSPGIDAMLYLISGCNELWQAGAETFFDFEAGAATGYDESTSSLSDKGIKLLRLALHFADGFKRENLIHTVSYYFSDLEYVHLELAIEAIRLAIFPRTA